MEWNVFSKRQKDYGRLLSRHRVKSLVVEILAFVGELRNLCEL